MLDKQLKNQRIDETPRGEKLSAFAGTKERLFLGIDIGSTSSDVIVFNSPNEIRYKDYRRTFGRPMETVYQQLQEVKSAFGPDSFDVIAATGSAGRMLTEIMELAFVNEVPAQAAALFELYPQIEQASVVEMGGQDSKLIFLERNGQSKRVRDFALNTVCAAGTGSFLDQQADRLNVSIEKEFGEMAVSSRSVPRVAGRCSVFAKSDMIHLQQQATPVEDIVAGLCLALARNLKSNLGCGRDFIKPIIFTGGVAANIGVVRAMREVFDAKGDELLIPELHFYTGAMGAAITIAHKQTSRQTVTLPLEKLENYLQSREDSLSSAPRREPLKKSVFPPPKSLVRGDLLTAAEEPIDAYLGVDVGSISTNVVVLDRNKNVLAKAYLMTASRPLEAVKQGLQQVGKIVGDNVRILGAATTGSGRYLTGDFIGADTVINEITAQAAGAAIVNPKVDTIFEIGGQDSKYISLRDGVVVDFEMNHACAAGTGSFIEEQSQRLGISIRDEFSDLALQSKSPLKLGERCTVFMESDLLSYQQQGAQTQDLVAGLAYSIVSNYLNRVVGRRRIGDNICFQGGTAFNKAVWAAFEKVTGKPIQVPDHHEVTGAIGAAAIAASHMNALAEEKGIQQQSTFRGFDNLVHLDYTVESFTCEHCANDCEVKKVQLKGSEPLYYGSRCDRYNLKKQSAKQNTQSLFDFRNKRLLEYSGLANNKKTGTSEKKLRVGLPRALANWQLLPLFSRFLQELGCEVVLSSPTTKATIRRGVEKVAAAVCFPMKVGYGHVAQLLEKEVDVILLPSIVSMPATSEENKHNHFCPYVQTFPYQIKSAFSPDAKKIVALPIRLGEGRKLLCKSFKDVAKKLGLSSKNVVKALRAGAEAQAEFEQCLIYKGREVLNNLSDDERLFVLVSRPYNGCDAGVNLQLPKKLAEHNVTVMPLDMLDVKKAAIDEEDKDLHLSTYWGYGQRILRAGEIIKRDPQLFAVYLSNFSCGPDSFIQTFFKDLMDEKPCLQLELDEHSADAGVVTRIEAFLESLKHYKTKDRDNRIPIAKNVATLKRTQKIYLPYMGDTGYAMAACFRAHGLEAEVIPIADEESLIRGRAYTTGKECLPCAITVGDMLKIVESVNFDPEKAAFFMPSASGPCRFGMYNCMHRLILKQAGMRDVAVVAPNQNSNFYSELEKMSDRSHDGSLVQDMWKSMVGVDLLHKVLLRVRPYALDRSEAQSVYENVLAKWCKTIEQNKSMSECIVKMREFAHEMNRVEKVRDVKKPKIGVIGEIYVRHHPFANNNVIARLEELGAECDLASLSEWIYYTNFTRAAMARRRSETKNLLTNYMKDFWQKRIEKKLAAPLEQCFGELVEAPTKEVLHYASPYMHKSFEGEAVLSIGKIVELYHHGFGGVVNVMPFTCMPSTIVSTQTMRISKDCDNLPILNISFDGQEDPVLTTRLEAFVEQVRQRQAPERQRVESRKVS